MSTDTRTSGDWVDREAYPFKDRHLKLPSGDEMHYVDEGSGPVVLFVHGTPSWSFEWRHLIRRLSSTHRCLAPDLLGFGLSDRPKSFAYTPEAHAAALAGFVDTLRLDRFTLVAHDFGGPIALPLALQDASPVDRLVLMNTWMWSFDDDEELRKKASLASGPVGRFLYRRLNASLRILLPAAWADRSTLTKRVHRQYLAPFPDADSREMVLWTLARHLLESGAYFDRLWQQRAKLASAETMVIWGVKDAALPLRLLSKLRQGLPHARVVELQAGHWPQESAPAETSAAVAGFLDG